MNLSAFRYTQRVYRRVIISSLRFHHLSFALTQLLEAAAKKMAYLSDIDLATLHKKRLEEKNNYKLSWYNSSNSRFYDDDDRRHRQIANSSGSSSSTSMMKREEHKVKSKVFSASHSVVKTRPSILQFNKAKSAARTVFDRDNNSAFDAVAATDTNCCYTASLDANGNSTDFFDEGYFSSPTMSRRRSGTWP